MTGDARREDGAAPLWSRLALAAGGEALPLDGALAVINPARRRLAEASRVVAGSRDGAFDASVIAEVLAAKGIARATCDVVGAGELLRERLEAEGYDPVRLVSTTRPEGAPAIVPPGCDVFPAEGDRDRFAWEQVVAEARAEASPVDEAQALAAESWSWLREAGASLWLATLSGAPAGAAALFVHGGESLAVLLTQRPAFRRRGVDGAMLRALREAAAGAGAPVLHREAPAEGLPAEAEAGTILRFEIRCD